VGEKRKPPLIEVSLYFTILDKIKTEM
jgi:hypothetical protein